MKKYDKDLNPVLEKATNEELKPIVEILRGKLSGSFSIETDERYKKDPDNPHAYADLIASEIREMGGNTFANIVRRGGVSYREIVSDIADRLGWGSSSKVEDYEAVIIQKLFDRCWKICPKSDKEAICAELGIETVDEKPPVSAVDLFRDNTKKLTERILAVASDPKFGHKSMIVFRIPKLPFECVGNLLSIPGPSYKTTTQCILHVAAIRQRLIAEGVLKVEV